MAVGLYKAWRWLLTTTADNPGNKQVETSPIILCIRLVQLEFQIHYLSLLALSIHIFVLFSIHAIKEVAAKKYINIIYSQRSHPLRAWSRRGGMSRGVVLFCVGLRKMRARVETDMTFFYVARSTSGFPSWLLLHLRLDTSTFATFPSLEMRLTFSLCCLLVHQIQKLARRTLELISL